MVLFSLETHHCPLPVTIRMSVTAWFPGQIKPSPGLKSTFIGGSPLIMFEVFKAFSVTRNLPNIRQTLLRLLKHCFSRLNQRHWHLLTYLLHTLPETVTEIPQRISGKVSSCVGNLWHLERTLWEVGYCCTLLQSSRRFVSLMLCFIIVVTTIPIQQYG